MPIDYKALAKEFPRTDWEWRVDGCGDKPKVWCRVVPYIQNRAIQERLDAVCGPNNWKNVFQRWGEKSQLCGISIYDESKGEWITKWDGAEDTNFQSTKGGLSSSMKRAAVQWGIGRHLYSQPFVYAECSDQKQKGWELAKYKTRGEAGKMIDKTLWWNPKDSKLTGAK